jgi:hypothetical protein
MPQNHRGRPRRQLRMEGAQVTTVLGVRIPGRSVARAADALIDSHRQGKRHA